MMNDIEWVVDEEFPGTMVGSSLPSKIAQVHPDRPPGRAKSVGNRNLNEAKILQSACPS